MATKFRIFGARTQAPNEFRATGEVPSPDPNAMAEALADPIAHRQKTVTYERDVIQQREAPRSTPIPGAPGSPDLLAELRRQRGEK